jgi:methionyl aminopeptidase
MQMPDRTSFSAALKRLWRRSFRGRTALLSRNDTQSNIILKSAADLERMRASGRVVARALNAMRDAIVPGKTTTNDLELIAVKVLSEAGASSPFLGYQPVNHPPYPAWTCISVNEEVVHGVPGRRVLVEGDIVGCDVGANVSGFYADGAWTFPVGRVSRDAERLLKVSEEALWVGIEQARVGRRVGDISHAIQRFVRKNGYTVVREMVGHGIGRSLHEDPQVPNYGKAGSGDLLRDGMTFCIEPMVNAGRKDIEALPDEWTIVTSDRSLSAHFEHTIAVTRNGTMILTQGE